MKKTISVLIIFLIVLGSLPVSAYEYTPYIGTEAVFSTAVSVTNEADEKVTALTAGEKLKASVRLKSADINANCATLVIATYSDGVLEEISTSGCQSIFTDKSTDFSTGYVTVPQLGAGVRVFICDDLEAAFAKPLFSMGKVGEFGKICGITVGGAALDGFAEDVYEYEVEVDAHYVTFPEIIALADNVMADVTVDFKGEFPLCTLDRGALCTQTVYTEGEAYAYVKCAGKTYTIKFTQKKPEITNLTPTYASGACDMGVVYSVHEPDWEAAGVTSLNEATSVVVDDYNAKFNENNGVKRSAIFSRGGGYTRGIMFDIAPELLGSHFLALYDDQSVKMSALSFNINRGARIYAYTGYDMTVDGWTKAPDKVMYRYFALTSKFKIIEGSQLYYKDVDILKNETGQYWSISDNEVILSVNNLKPFVFVKFEDNKPVDNVKYAVGESETASTAVAFRNPLIKNPESGDLAWYANGSEGAGGLDDGYLPGVGSGNIMAASFVFSDKATRNNSGYFPFAIDNEIEGGYAAQIPSSGVSKVSFNLHSPADVYVLTNYDVADLEGYLDGFETLGDEGVAAKIRTGAADSFEMLKETSFKKTYFVEFGDCREVSIELPGEDKSVMVIIKPTELK